VNPVTLWLCQQDLKSWSDLTLLWLLNRRATFSRTSRKGSDGLPQKTIPAKQLFDPATEDVISRFADDQNQVLEQTTDLVLKITLDLDQLVPAVQHRPDLVTRHALE